MKYLNFDLFQDYFEISHKNMKFTSEAKSTNEFSFLYMTISNKSGKFETLVSHTHGQLCSNVIKKLTIIPLSFSDVLLFVPAGKTFIKRLL